MFENLKRLLIFPTPCYTSNCTQDQTLYVCVCVFLGSWWAIKGILGCRENNVDT